MTWWMDLYETYERNASQAGKFYPMGNGKEYALLPVAHTTQNAQIEVALSGTGNFVSARVVEKRDSSTVIPCTAASAARSGRNFIPHPLFDKLPYVAGDYMQYGGSPERKALHTDYMKRLGDWCASECANPKVQSVYTYLKKGALIGDLLRAGVLHADESGRLLDKWSAEGDGSEEKPDIFKVLAGDQRDAFVRFSVQIPGDLEPRLWRDPATQQSFTAYCESAMEETDWCYATGELRPIAKRHASRIRHAADMAKLISSNDNEGFTYRGRFKDASEAVAISYAASQKAHNALKWLIARQGYSIDGRVFLVWGTDGEPVPQLLDSGESIYEEPEDQAPTGDETHAEFAEQVKRALQGYKSDLAYKADVIVLVLDAATTGRLAVTYYRNMEKELFLERVQRWHTTCFWRHSYKSGEGKQLQFFCGPPATRDIAMAAYGSHANEKVVKGLLERMLPAVLDGRPIPFDIVRSAVRRASNPVGMERWEWEKTLSTACALVNKQYGGERLTVALDQQNDSRDYLFGRLLAIADVLERSALGSDEKRATNAIRYMNAFSQHPLRTWSIIQANIQPYQAKLGTKLGYFNQLLDEVGARIAPESFTDKPLSGLYLLGFYSQRHELYRSKKTAPEEAVTQEGEQ